MSPTNGSPPELNSDHWNVHDANLRKPLLELAAFVQHVSAEQTRTAAAVERMAGDVAEMKGVVMRIEACTLATAARTERLDEERELPITRIERTRREVDALRVSLATARARTGEQERRIARLEGSAETTGKHLAVTAEVLTRDSIHSRRTWRKAVAAIFIAVATALAGWASQRADSKREQTTEEQEIGR